MEQGKSTDGELKAKFIAVIWGARYVREFAAVSLPSYLADGNIPSLARECDLEILIMTTEESTPAFEREPAFRRLQKDYKVRFNYIDDLVTNGAYGVTLTLAFARAVMDSGPDQTETYFVFMNADFVLAEGSLRSLIARMRAGEPCIMAPSLRARAEAVLPALSERVDRQQHVLSVKPRELVRLTLDNLHATVIGKTVTQEFVNCTTHNQIYWQADMDTLLGRYFLIFMLAIKPERPMPPVNSYCDYGLVPELVPSGRFSVLEDSDDFFMLELQPAAQEREFLRCGHSTAGQIASELSRWTTKEHRRFAEVEIVFHAQELADDLPAKQQRFADFFERVRLSMSRAPLDHVDHIYWVLGLQSWSQRKKMAIAGRGDDGKSMWEHLTEDEVPLPSPPELRSGALSDVDNEFPHLAEKSILSRLYMKILKFLYKLRGTFPEVPIWHALWLDARLVLGWADKVSRRGGRTLFVHEQSSQLTPAIKRRAKAEAISIEELLSGITGRSPGYDDVLVHLRQPSLLNAAQVLDVVTDMIKPGGTMVVFIETANSGLDSSNLASELAQHIDDIFPPRWRGYRISAVFVGGTVKRGLRLAERMFAAHLSPGPIERWPLCFVSLLFVLPAVAIFTTAHNLARRRAKANCPPYCSSALLSLNKPRTPGIEAASEACYREQEAPVPQAVSAT